MRKEHAGAQVIERDGAEPESVFDIGDEVGDFVGSSNRLPFKVARSLLKLLFVLRHLDQHLLTQFPLPVAKRVLNDTFEDRWAKLKPKFLAVRRVPVRILKPDDDIQTM